jgi:hypothetical protein
MREIVSVEKHSFLRVDIVLTLCKVECEDVADYFLNAVILSLATAFVDDSLLTSVEILGVLFHSIQKYFPLVEVRHNYQALWLQILVLDDVGKFMSL